MKSGTRTTTRTGLLASTALAALLALGAVAPAQSVPVPAPEPKPSGVGGKVTAVPNPCPVHGCKREPVRAIVAAWQDGRMVAWSRTRRGGRYAMDLRPGMYALAAYPRARRIFCEPEVVRVPQGQHVRANIGCLKGLPTARAERG